MRKLDLILEDIRDEYMINLLEEGETTELETLKTKKFLQENLNRIRKMLIEEGALEGVKQHLGDNWGKYLSGIGAAGAGALGAATGLGGDIADTAVDAYHQVPGIVADGGYGEAANHVGANLAGDLSKAGDVISGAAGQASDYAGGLATQAGDAIGGAYDKVDAMVGGPEQAQEEHMAALQAAKQGVPEGLSPTQLQPEPAPVIPEAWKRHG